MWTVSCDVRAVQTEKGCREIVAVDHHRAPWNMFGPIFSIQKVNWRETAVIEKYPISDHTSQSSMSVYFPFTVLATAPKIVFLGLENSILGAWILDAPYILLIL